MRRIGVVHHPTDPYTLTERERETDRRHKNDDDDDLFRYNDRIERREITPLPIISLSPSLAIQERSRDMM
jgi:hypothetical protein